MEPDKEHPPENVRQILLWLATRTVALEFVQSALRGGNLEAVRVSAEVALATGPDFATLLAWINGHTPAEQFAAEVEKSRKAGEAAARGEIFGFPVVVSDHVPPDVAFWYAGPFPPDSEVLAALRRKAPAGPPPAEFPLPCVDPLPLKTMRTAWGFPVDQPPPAEFPPHVTADQFPAILQAIKRYRHNYVFPVLMHPEWLERFPELKRWPEVVQPLPVPPGKGEA